jgi:hypothetical protein
MKNPSKSARLTQGRPPRPAARKKHRRHTRLQLDAMRPSMPPLLLESLSDCPKCHGLLYVDGGETLSEKVVRCLNCGWQPFHRISLIEEPEEARTMRALTVQIGSSSDFRNQSIAF